MKKINKMFATSFLVLLLISQFYFLAEYSFAVTDNVIVTLQVDSGITISDGAAVTMAPNLGVTAHSSIGGSAWTVITNNTTGYSLAVKATTAPALVSGVNSFADYTEAVLGTPDVWTVPSGSKEFGYSAYGTDTAPATWGTVGAGACGAAGVPNAGLKYAGTQLTDKIIATRATVTPTTGIATSVCFAAEQDTIFAPSGTYTATIVGTAVTL